MVTTSFRDYKSPMQSVMLEIFLILIGIYFHHAEYSIKEKVGSSYLNHSFDHLPGEMFPTDLTIVMHLSKVLGTLLYSVDSNANQLIISINDENNPTLDIELSKEHIYVSLAKLCNLESAKYTKLKLRLQMRQVMYLQCNDGPMDSHKYELTQRLNKDYPIPSFSSSEKMQAKLWLVNTPHMDGIYPNNAQLSGCIFDVLYKEQSLKMGKFGAGEKCHITCTKNICNSGQCLETYGAYPDCNCTSAFYNGRYCNDTKYNGTYESNQPLQSNALKIVFKSYKNGPILKLTNQNSNITVEVLDGKLLLRMESIKPFRMLHESVISEKYTRNCWCIVILTFYEKFVDVQYFANGSFWTKIRIPYYKDLGREMFNYILLAGEEIDLRFKNNIKEIQWLPLLNHTYNIFWKRLPPKIDTSSLLPDNGQNTTSISSTVISGLHNLSNKVSWMFGIMILFAIMLIVIISVMLKYQKKMTGLLTPRTHTLIDEEKMAGLLTPKNDNDFKMEEITDLLTRNNDDDFKIKKMTGLLTPSTNTLKNKEKMTGLSKPEDDNSLIAKKMTGLLTPKNNNSLKKVKMTGLSKPKNNNSLRKILFRCARKVCR